MTDLIGDAPRLDERLGFRWVVHMFLRTWPFIRPSLVHFVYFLALSGAVALVTLFLRFIVFGLVMTGIVAADPNRRDTGRHMGT